jgi:hypothetical protein
VGASVSDGAGLFRVLAEGCYQLSFPDHGVEFTVDRLRRERHELFCELSVACGILGARAIDGVLSVGTFNLSSPAAAQQRARLLAERARTRGLDWSGLLEELRQRTLTAERAGQPSILLRAVQTQPEGSEEFEILGLTFPKRHPSILFGDGGTLKSFVALLAASQLEAAGEHALFADWELDEFTHRRRLEAITGRDMPPVRYARCDRPLVHEVDRLRRIVRQDGIGYVFKDSIAYGTAGAPESAEAAMDFCRAARQLGVGALWLAHQTKGENADQRPFGSTFWFNSARCVWNLKLASTSPDGQTLHLAAFHRKSNLGRLRPPVGIRAQFDGGRVYFESADVTTMDEVAASLPLWQRIRGIVKAGPQTLATIASELKYDNVESIDRTVRKHKGLFTRVSGADGVARIALVERRAS